MAFDFDIGAPVRCEGETCGRLLKVVVDPHTRRVTDLIVERGFLDRTDLVVPASVVADAGDEGVSLAIETEALKEYPEYHEEELRKPATGWGTEQRYTAENTRCWVEPYAIACKRPVVPMVRYKVHQGIRSDREVIERGTPVSNAGGKYGLVDHVLVDPESGQMQYLVVRRGIIPYYPIVPIEMVEYIDDEGIYVRATTDALNRLLRFRTRSDEDIQAELDDRLGEMADDRTDIRVTVRQGSAQLAGVVTDVASKRRAEATARSIPGMVAVENALDISVAIVARVTAALVDDPRTHLAVIDVSVERGIVMLSGQVDSAEVRQVAEEIASQQRGVISVVNELDVTPDEYTPQLSVLAALGAIGGYTLGGTTMINRY